jgi:hypothetical protein
MGGLDRKRFAIGVIPGAVLGADMRAEMNPYVSKEERLKNEQLLKSVPGWILGTCKKFNEKIERFNKKLREIDSEVYHNSYIPNSNPLALVNKDGTVELINDDSSENFLCGIGYYKFTWSKDNGLMTDSGKKINNASELEKELKSAYKFNCTYGQFLRDVKEWWEDEVPEKTWKEYYKILREL